MKSEALVSFSKEGGSFAAFWREVRDSWRVEAGRWEGKTQGVPRASIRDN